MSRILLAPAHTTINGVRARSTRSALTSIVCSPPRCTPPIPPVTNTPMFGDAAAASTAVPDTVVAALRPSPTATARSRRDAFVKPSAPTARSCNSRVSSPILWRSSGKHYHSESTVNARLHKIKMKTSRVVFTDMNRRIASLLYIMKHTFTSYFMGRNSCHHHHPCLEHSHERLIVSERGVEGAPDAPFHDCHCRWYRTTLTYHILNSLCRHQVVGPWHSVRHDRGLECHHPVTCISDGGCQACDVSAYGIAAALQIYQAKCQMT